MSGIVGVTFLLYEDEQGGAPLWLETQNVRPDENGHYSVMLGSTMPEGLPTDLFAQGEARWLGVQAEGQAEHPRVLLFSVPYALKAGDAQTAGGLPASAFVLANGTKEGATSGTSSSSAPAPGIIEDGPSGESRRDGQRHGRLSPHVDTTSDIVNSILFQKSSKIGVGTTSPAALFDVNCVFSAYRGDFGASA